jgi:hypothetical protein
MSETSFTTPNFNAAPNFNSTTTTITTYPWDQISTPGTYVCNWSGHLLRVPADALSGARVPQINIVGCQPLFVTKISNDPFMTIGQARLTACNQGLSVNF